MADKQSGRPRNQGWDGLAAVFEYEPVSGTSEAKLWGKLARELNTIGVTVEDVLEAAHRYRERMPMVELTPTALVKHYQRLMHGREFGSRRSDRIGDAIERLRQEGD
jgi:hypothetical protein